MPLPSQTRFEPHDVPGDAFDGLQTGVPVVQLYVPGAQVVRFHVPRYVRKVTLFADRTSAFRRLAQKIPFARRIVHKMRASRPSMFIA